MRRSSLLRSATSRAVPRQDALERVDDSTIDSPLVDMLSPTRQDRSPALADAPAAGESTLDASPPPAAPRPRKRLLL